MKNLYKYLKESLLGDMENTLNNGDNIMLASYIIENIFNDNDEIRQKSIEGLYKLVIDNKPKRLNTANKIKNSDKYFIEFSNIRIGSHDDYVINNISIVKKITDNYYHLVGVTGRKAKHYKNIISYKQLWKNVKENLYPKEDELYEVPASLEYIFDKIIINADKYTS